MSRVQGNRQLAPLAAKTQGRVSVQGFRGLGFRGLGFRGLGFRGLGV